MKTPGYNDSVFINCPFDEEYRSIFRAILYTVFRCGFFPRTALEEDDGTDNRLDKIIRKISECRYGIHDISRIEVNAASYPRFNMPFELGIFFGAKRLGDSTQRTKNALVLERTKYSAQQLISDLNGFDPKSHDNDPVTAMRKVRDWLATDSKRKTLPGYNKLNTQYDEFRRGLPAVVRKLGFTVRNIPYFDLLNIIETTVEAQLKRE